MGHNTYVARLAGLASLIVIPLPLPLFQGDLRP